MNTKEWEKKIEITYKILDKLPIFDYLHIGIPTYLIMEQIEGSYEDNEFSEEISDLILKELNGDLFNYIATYEFEDYCHNRYGTNFQEVSTSYCYWKGENNDPSIS